MEPNHTNPNSIEGLASYNHCQERIRAEWPGFLARPAERLQPHPLFGNTPEKITESILEDLFTAVLDWPRNAFVPQVEFADIVLSNLGIRWIIVEAKRPGSLAWNRRAVDRALEQARGYADKQRVHCVAVSDGVMLYAEDIVDGGSCGRVFVSLATPDPPLDLWWLSVQGIYRPRDSNQGAVLQLLPDSPVDAPDGATAATSSGEPLLHPKYKLPARCFAYVGNHADTHSWKLPYLQEDGTIDARRLPKAIQSIITNYRGARVSGIPEESIPAVLTRLARAAALAGHLPAAITGPAAYRHLQEVLDQFKIQLQID